MAETRSKSYIHLIGEPLVMFGGRVLPTVNEVLRVYFHRHKKQCMSQKDAVKAVVMDICEIWCKARIPTCEERHIVRKFNTVLEDYRNLCRNKSRKGPAQIAREEAFQESIKHLFDISHHDALNIIKIEEDMRFLLDQQSDRRYVMGGIDRDLAQREANKMKRIQTVHQRQMKEEDRKRKAAEALVASDNICSADDEGELPDHSEHDESEESESDSNGDASGGQNVALTKRAKLQTRGIKVRASEVVSPALAAALDRTNISDRKAAYLLTAAAQTYTDADVSALPLSSSSIRRSRAKHRAQCATATKADFCPEELLVLHFDGKLLPAISGGATKEDRVAILVTGHEVEKLLGVPKVGQGTGEQLANVAHTAVLDWKIEGQIVGISFDTTAANTGRLNGACTLLEYKMQKQLLWLACRHHVLEVLCGDVFKAVFGSTSGPTVPIFRRFQEYWPMVDQAAYEPCTDVRLSGDLESAKNDAISFFSDVLSKSGRLPREDYRELVELATLFLGELPPRGARFRVPGAFHHARWMAKLLYVLKLNLFRSQFKLTARESSACLEFGLFVALVYAKAWITCTNSCDAPLNDLNLVCELVSYASTSETISRAAMNALNRHLWYLSEEIVPISLFSDQVPDDTKRLMVRRLHEICGHGLDIQGVRSNRCLTQDLATIVDRPLESFIGPGSSLFFSVLRIDSSFMEVDVREWQTLDSFQQARKVARALKVVNDSAERGVALATTFNSSITKQEEQKQFLYQVVESHRRKYPNPAKKTLFPSKD